MTATLSADAQSLIKQYGAQASGWAKDHAAFAKESVVKARWHKVATEIQHWLATKRNPRGKNPTRGFDYGEDPEYGNKGLRPGGMEGFNYGTGMQAAHDLLEHFPKDQGFITDEFQALGAMIWVRGAEYYAEKGRKDPRVEPNVAADMLNLFNYMRGGQYPKGPLDTPLKKREVEDFNTRDFLQECKTYIKHDVEPEDASAFKDFCKKAIPWIQKGYYRAVKRYGKMDRGMLRQVFTDIETVTDKVIGTLGDSYGEGHAVKLHYNLKTGEVRATVPSLRYEIGEITP